MPPRYSLQRLVIAWGITLLLHAGALAVAGWVSVTRTGPVEIIRISLRPGGGGGGGGAATQAPPPSAPAPAPVPVEAVPPIAPPVPPPAVVAPQVTRPHPAVVTRPQAPRHPRRAPPQEQPAPAAPAPEAAVASAPGVGDAVGSGGPGTGTAAGSGTGVGAGSGSGSGAGAGAGPDTDQRASCVYCPEPGYPLLARRHGWRGSVDVALVLLADGRVDSASVRRSSGYSILDEEAVAAARRSRFQLAQGVDAPVHGRIEYRFELRP